MAGVNMLQMLYAWLLPASRGAVLFCLLLVTVAHAGPRTFVVGVEDQPYLPYFTVVDGEYQGYARELLEAFAQAKGYQFDFKPLPIKRLRKRFFEGKLDFKFPDNPLWREKDVVGPAIHFSAPLAAYMDGALVRPMWLGQGMQRIKVLGTQLGFTPVAYQADIDGGQIRLEQVTRIESLLRMAQIGRVDAVYMNPLVARYALRSAGLPEDVVVFDATLPHVSSHYYLASLEHEDVLDELNRFLLEQAELVNQLKRKYGIPK